MESAGLECTVARVDGTSLITVHSEDSRWRLVACLAGSPWASGPPFLAPVRMMEVLDVDEERTKHVTELVRQTHALGVKLTTLDELGLSTTRLRDAFASARIFVFGVSKQAPLSWESVPAAVEALARIVRRRIVTQLDYDQRRMHPELGGQLDAIDFKTRHYPSAASTVAVFRAVLECAGVALPESRWSILGVGALGSEIVPRLVKLGVAHVEVCDINPTRVEACRGMDRVTIRRPDQFPDSNTHAIVLSADTGSLPQSAAKRFGARDALVAVGGPEAGLDRDRDVPAILTRAGKHFVPSALCGSLGLVSNLEEVLGITADFEQQVSRVHAFATHAMRLALRDGMGFHEAYLTLLKRQTDTSTQAVPGRV